jgi:hypothetical protein
LPGSDQTSDGSKAPADDADAGTDDDATTDQAATADEAVTDQGATASTDDQDAVAAVNGNGDGAVDTSGDFTGWQMPFTDPYGYFNMAVAPAWDSAYPYLPPDYWYPGMGWW